MFSVAEIDKVVSKGAGYPGEFYDWLYSGQQWTEEQQTIFKEKDDVLVKLYNLYKKEKNND